MQKSPLECWVENLPPHQANPKRNPSINKNKSLSRDYSFQSDDGTSVCSSVESFLELRRPDPEEVLMELGFGPSKKSEKINRIPARFLQPSKLLPHIDVNKFLEDNGKKNPESNDMEDLRATFAATVECSSMQLRHTFACSQKLKQLSPTFLPSNTFADQT
ncbi:unnamed protein product [Psylliodes chrysocephalus]|uniref:ITPR-interacting domain-containing protein n=1 Tax=Psylliodes chrysocephalus TaxID=3402493 RepID=A0A9P0CST5_9CUCU|nr:unnamed protein product [Psylliodes chrysocephala]